MNLGTQLIQILYWLSLSTWFGGTLFIAVAAPIIFRTVREADPTLPKVLSVNLEGQHGTLLAGSIVANILHTLNYVQLACAGAMLLAQIGQWIYRFRVGGSSALHLIATILYIAAAALVVYHWASLWPRIRKARQEYLDNADNPDVANPAKELFDRLHQDSVSILTVQLFLLLGMIFFSTTPLAVINA